jgi:recombination protein RecR
MDQQRGTDPISRLIIELMRLPGIGEKTATRLAYAVLGWGREEARSLAEAITDVKEKVRFCTVCFNLSETEPCSICSDDSRTASVVCVVEDPKDLKAVEKSHSFKGKYHVLHGVLSPLNGIGPEKLKIKELVGRVREGTARDLIIATNPTVEGDATALYIMQAVKPYGIKITRIGYGMPMGGDLEYVDQMTISKAVENRREM